jgi:putative transcriptional regulator
MQTVVETPSYLADAERLFSSEERRAIIDRLASDPTCGVVIPGSGGLCKVRFGFGARGKKRWRAHYLPVQWSELAGVYCGRVCKKREGQSDGCRAERAVEDGHDTGRRLSEEQMTKTAFNKIKAGLEDAKAFLEGSADRRSFGIHVPSRVNVKKIRTCLGLSQESFAQTYGFALSAVRDWEQGRRQPERSARILLKVVEKEPEAVKRALAKTA